MAAVCEGGLFVTKFGEGNGCLEKHPQQTEDVQMQEGKGGKS